MKKYFPSFTICLFFARIVVQTLTYFG